MSQSPAPAPDGVDPLIGEVLGGRYRVLELIAKGGMGRIYKAEQVGLGRLIALKILDENPNDPEGFRKRFTLEASTSAKLTHPNIVVVHDYGSFELRGARRYFMAMELIDGPTLGQLLKREGRLEVGRAAFIAREIARALRDAHRHGVVHRDLKPSNVMLVERSDGEHVKVVDFGIAKVAQGPEQDEGEEQLTREGMFVGTPRYMSPEQLSGGAIDARSDLYSLGVLLYQMIAGRPPYAAKDVMQALVAHLQDPTPELPDDVIDAVPPALREVIATCLAKIAAERYQDATAFLRALDIAAAGLPGWAGPAPSGERPLARHSGAITVEDPSYPSGSAPRLVSRPRVESEVPMLEPARPSDAGEAPTRLGKHGPVASTVEAQPAPSRTGLWAGAVLVALALVGGVVGWSMLGTPETPAAAPQPPAPPAPAVRTTPEAPPTSPAPPEPAPPPAAARFRLTIDSEPQGARVLEGERTLGQTPLTVELDPEALRTSPRAYRIELEGHAPYEFTQGPSARDVEVRAALVALRTRPTRPVRPRDDGPTIGPAAPEDRMLKTSR